MNEEELVSLGVLHLYDLDRLLDLMDDCDGEPTAEWDCE